MNDPSVLESQPDSQRARQTEPALRGKKNTFSLPRKLFLAAVAAGFFALAAFIIIVVAKDLPPLTEIEKPQSNRSTQLVSADGVILDNFYLEENRVNVSLNQISPFVIDALIATEDIRFYGHSGVDYMTLPAIVKRNFTGTTSGASTITMQLSRNLFDAVGKDRTAIRKFKEVIVAAIIERSYTKEEILAAYLNTVNIYSNAYGIEMAAQRLFGVSAADLKVEEAAVLVAMLKGQGVYNPIRKQDVVIERRNVVINQMVKYNFLNAKAINVDSLKALPLIVAEQTQDHVKGLAPYFRQEVKKVLKEWCDAHGIDLYTSGLRVYTTIDSRLQQHAEAAVKEHLSGLQAIFDKHLKGHEPYKKDKTILMDMRNQSARYAAAKKAGKTEAEIDQEFDTEVRMDIFSWKGEIKDTLMSPMDSIKYYLQFLETGFVSLDPRDGRIKAWVGGIDFKYFKYDHVAKGKRQVGSTFKPFVYAAAMANGRRPCEKELNQPITFENIDGNGARWTPKNADGSYGGMVTLQQGLAQSINLITARLIKQLTPRTVAEYAYKMGIKTHLEEVYSLCLGTTDLNVLELTGAYGTIANQGKWVDPNFITRIEDRNGKVLEEFPPKSHQALSEKDAYLMVELLKGVVDGGTGGRLRFRYNFKNEIGAKTGTTQNHSDGWFMGITPNLVSGVWVGCADRRVRFRTIEYGQGASMALPIWAIYMKKVYEDPRLKEEIPIETFHRPPGIELDLDCRDRNSYGDPILRTLPGLKSPSSSDDLDNF